MSAIVQPHRRNPSRRRQAPRRYTDSENPMKGSGKLGEVNGIDFDQYDRQYDGDWHRENMSYSEKIKEAGDNRRMEILTKKLQVINTYELRGRMPPFFVFIHCNKIVIFVLYNVFK